MSPLGSAAPARVGAVSSVRARRSLRLAWISVAILPLAFVGAMFLGDGLLTLQGYQSGDSDIPAQVVLRAGIPAVRFSLLQLFPRLASASGCASSGSQRELFQHSSGSSLPESPSFSTLFRWLWACRQTCSPSPSW